MTHSRDDKFVDDGSPVDVIPGIVDVSISQEEYGFVVQTIWSGVDRPVGAGIVASNRKLADRLANAIRAGVAVRSEGVARDVNGKTFVLAAFAVRARTLNADLTRLGF